MNIKDLEKVTGITKQNIRFYEKQGLINPSRNPKNDYREYTQEDIRIFKLIKVMRKLQMPIEQIKQIIKNEVNLDDALHSHLTSLQQEREQLDAVISFCKGLEKEHLDINTLDIDSKLEEINNQEKAGSKFGYILHDFMAVAKAEESKQFSFEPNTMITTPREFTDALLKYADEKNLNIVITKESMYPEFRIDEEEYTAERRFGWYFSIITCSLKHPETVEPQDISPKKRNIYKMIWKLLFPTLLFLYMLCTAFSGYSSDIKKAIPLIVILMILTFIVSITWWFSHPSIK